jgi:hypothetical protein
MPLTTSPFPCFTKYELLSSQAPRLAALTRTDDCLLRHSSHVDGPVLGSFQLQEPGDPPVLPCDWCRSLPVNPITCSTGAFCMHPRHFSSHPFVPALGHSASWTKGLPDSSASLLRSHGPRASRGCHDLETSWHHLQRQTAGVQPRYPLRPMIDWNACNARHHLTRQPCNEPHFTV